MFAFRKDELLVRDLGPPLPTPAELGDPEGIEIGSLGGAPCRAVAWAGAAPAGCSFANLRALFGRLDPPTWHMAGRALQLLEWDRTSRFCGACASATERALDDWSRRCPSCGLAAYPRIAPAVIVLIERGDEALLAQPARMRMFYSTLAGFVEPGETLEETIAREIGEEVGLEVRDPRYFGSQPWPFPHSLMIGFHATWAGGELRVDPRELGDAGWFRFDALPTIPPRVSIARALIDDWVARRRRP